MAVFSRREPVVLVRIAILFLRLEVHGGFEATIHVEGHRFMLVRDLPFVADLPEAERVSKPEIVLLAIGRSVNPVETMAKGHIVAHSHTQTANLIANPALPRGEPRVQVLRVSLRGD